MWWVGSWGHAVEAFWHRTGTRWLHPEPYRDRPCCSRTRVSLGDNVRMILDSRFLTPRRLLMASVVVALITITLKTLAWYITDSVGLLSDAMESLVNLASAIFGLVMVTIAARPADEDHPYGHHKAEYFSAVLEGVLIVLAAVAAGKIDRRHPAVLEVEMRHRVRDQPVKRRHEVLGRRRGDRVVALDELAVRLVHRRQVVRERIVPGQAGHLRSLFDNLEVAAARRAGRGIGGGLLLARCGRGIGHVLDRLGAGGGFIDEFFRNRSAR